MMMLEKVIGYVKPDGSVAGVIARGATAGTYMIRVHDYEFISRRHVYTMPKFLAMPDVRPYYEQIMAYETIEYFPERSFISIEDTPEYWIKGEVVYPRTLMMRCLRKEDNCDVILPMKRGWSRPDCKVPNRIHKERAFQQLRHEMLAQLGLVGRTREFVIY